MSTKKAVNRAGVNLPVAALGRKEREDYAAVLKASLLDTHTVLEAAVSLRNARDIIEIVEGEIKEDVLSSIPEKGGVEVLGAKIEVGSRRSWEYEDATLAELEAEKKVLDEKIKARQKFLQVLGKPMADAATGEIVQPARLLSEGRTPRVTLAK